IMPHRVLITPAGNTLPVSLPPAIKTGWGHPAPQADGKIWPGLREYKRLRGKAPSHRKNCV
ncbi:hypothetical protein, partial [Acetobacter tropicalis]